MTIRKEKTAYNTVLAKVAVQCPQRQPLEQKLNDLHHNPVRAGWVEHPEDFLHSSARAYSGKTGLIHGVTVLS